jgi:hypothetical protein
MLARLEALAPSGGGTTAAMEATAYGDENVANRDTRVWRGATEKGP